VLRLAYAAYECRLVDDITLGDHHLLIGEVVAVHWEKKAFMEDGSLDISRVSPVMYLGNEHYVSAEGCTMRSVDREFCIDCFRG
jgi:flavin reductase (DIM6/NTAB) family NADH-FMN oxidoreductase RutF